MNVKAWLQLFRAQTAPATVLSILLPYLLAGGRDLLTIIVIIVFGTLLHWFSFGHNSLMDYWYDIHDPNKKHHPLEAGIIKFEHAHQVIHYGMVIVFGLLALLTFYVSPNPAIALLFLMGYCVWGHAYNDGLDKNTSHSWISISLCFTSLTMYGWFLATSEFNTITLLVALWAFLTIFYQIAWEGNLKDLWNPAEKNNLLKKLGVKLELDYEHIEYQNGKVVKEFRLWRINVPKWLDSLMWFIRYWINSIVIITIAICYGYYILEPTLSNLLFTIMFLLTYIVKAYLIDKIHKIIKKSFERQELLELFGKAEAFEFFHFATILFVLGLGWVWTILLIYGIGYFVTMNKLLWNSRFGPKV